jgi:hypothetical protein
MHYCEEFKDQVEQKFNIKYHDWNMTWVFNTDWDEDSQCEVIIKYCPFCGARLE